jgi:hypothetical protein
MRANRETARVSNDVSSAARALASRALDPVAFSGEDLLGSFFLSCMNNAMTDAARTIYANNLV